MRFIVIVMILIAGQIGYQSGLSDKEEELEDIPPEKEVSVLYVPILPEECYDSLTFALSTGLRTTLQWRDFRNMTPHCFEAVDTYMPSIEEPPEVGVFTGEPFDPSPDTATEFEMEEAFLDCIEDENSEEECEQLYEEYLEG